MAAAATEGTRGAETDAVFDNVRSADPSLEHRHFRSTSKADKSIQSIGGKRSVCPITGRCSGLAAAGEQKEGKSTLVNFVQVMDLFFFFFLEAVKIAGSVLLLLYSMILSENREINFTFRPAMTRIEILLNEDGSFAMCDPEFEKGTTAFGFEFDEGIMVSINHSESAKNVVVLNSEMLVTISGGSEFLLQDLQKMCCEKERKEGRKTSVAEALKFLTEPISAHKEELQIGILIAVGNEKEVGLYHMDSQGKVVAKDLVATGSGSAFTGPLEFRRKRDISATEASNLAKRAICLAAYSAPHSEDFFSVYHLGRDGCKKVSEGNAKEWQKVHLKNFPEWKYVVIGRGW